jgi:hypothetical protein
MRQNAIGLEDRQLIEFINYGIGIGVWYALPSKPADTCEGPVILGEGLEMYTVRGVHCDWINA